MHEFLVDAAVIAPRFSIAGGAFGIRGARLSHDFLSLGAGLAIESNDHLSVFGSYDAQTSASENGHGGNGGLQIRVVKRRA